ncbi:MAG: YdcF family protein [Gemmatimonadetes bacterium]|nr:YdcF family protein [Gemmatimonadota bacterium]
MILRRLSGALGIVAALWCCSLLAVLWVGARDCAAPADAIIVLGAAHYGGKPSPVLQARLDQALALYQRGLAPRVILTGGTAPGDQTSEAAVGRSYLRRAGVPATAMLMESEGRTTRASLTAVAAFTGPLEIRRVILVSDPFHLLRARTIARRLGFEALTSPAQQLPLRSWILSQPRYLLQESIKAPLTVVLNY